MPTSNIAITASGQFTFPIMDSPVLFNPDGTTNLKSIRKLVFGGISARKFASLLDVSFETYKKWEYGDRNPSGPAAALLRIAVEHPDIFKKAVLNNNEVLNDTRNEEASMAEA